VREYLLGAVNENRRYIILNMWRKSEASVTLSGDVESRIVVYIY